MLKDKMGGDTDCFAYDKKTCKALKSWYNGKGNDRCNGCPFFKTKAQAKENEQKRKE